MNQNDLVKGAVDAKPARKDLDVRLRSQWSRLVSSLAALVLILGGMQHYAIQKTRTLERVGLDDHIHCAIAGLYPQQTERVQMVEGLGPYSPMLQPIVDQSPGDQVESAHRCTVNGRIYVHVILRRGTTLISVILTKRSQNSEAFPGSLTTFMRHGDGPRLHEEGVDGYSVAGFEAGAYLGYVISGLPGQQNSELAGRVAPVVRRYTGA